jgi:hypothetical protein
MWVTTRRGFFSVVQHRDGAEFLLVRSRGRADLEHFCADTGGDQAAIEEDPHADYRFRLKVPRPVFAEWLLEQAARLDYDSHCKEEMTKDPTLSEPARYRWYLACWSAGMAFQTRDEPRKASLYMPQPGEEPDWRSGTLWDAPGGVSMTSDDFDDGTDVEMPEWGGPDEVTLDYGIPEEEWEAIATAIGGEVVILSDGMPQIELGGYEGGRLIFRSGDTLDMLELREDLLIYLIDQES